MYWRVHSKATVFPEQPGDTRLRAGLMKGILCTYQQTSVKHMVIKEVMSE